MLFSLVIFFITGLIFSGLAYPLIKKKIKINNWYGIRIPQTMQSESIWYEVNSIIGKYIFSWGLFISGLSLYFYLNPIQPEFLMAYIILGILILGSIVLVIMSFKVANRISLKYFRNKNN